MDDICCISIKAVWDRNPNISSRIHLSRLYWSNLWNTLTVLREHLVILSHIKSGVNSRIYRTTRYKESSPPYHTHQNTKRIFKMQNFKSLNHAFADRIHRYCTCCHICHIWHPVSFLWFKNEFLSYTTRCRFKTHLFYSSFYMVMKFWARTTWLNILWKTQNLMKIIPKFFKITLSVKLTI